MEKIEKLKSFLIQSPQDPFLSHALALEYVKAGNIAEAKKLFLDVLTRDPSYIGSYYHLAKLFESSGDTESAKQWYEKGMVVSKVAGDQKTFHELEAALEDLTE
jgi:predicted Zn-dependent protease